MRKRNIDPSEVWTSICDVVVKTLVSIQAGLAQSYRMCQNAAEGKTPFNAFEVGVPPVPPVPPVPLVLQARSILTNPPSQLLGFDILLTDRLRAVLLEVNHMPSFRTDSVLDKVRVQGRAGQGCV